MSKLFLAMAVIAAALYFLIKSAIQYKKGILLVNGELKKGDEAKKYFFIFLFISIFTIIMSILFLIVGK